MSSHRIEADAVPLSGTPENAVLRIIRRKSGEWVIYNRNGSIRIQNDQFLIQMNIVAAQLLGEDFDPRHLSREQYFRIRRAAAQGLTQAGADAVRQQKKGAPRESAR